TGGPDFSSSFLAYNVTSKAGSWTNRWNGTQIFTTATNVVGVNTSSNIAQQNLNGDVSEILIYNRELTTQERSDAFTYLLDPNSWGTGGLGSRNRSGISASRAMH